MDRRTLLQQNCKISGKRLPSEYARVEYLESTGTQWIDSGYITTKNTKIDTTFQYTAINTDKTLFGAENWDIKSMFVTWIHWELANKIDVAITNNDHIAFDIDTNKHRLVFNDEQHRVMFDDNHMGTFTKFNSYNSPNITLLIFSLGYVNQNVGDGQNYRYNAKVKLYSFKMYEGSVVIHNFLPVVRLSDMKPGLYDMVNDQFYVNQGTGEFLYGPYVEPLPDVPGTYQKVEYLEGTGTQWIDSGVIPTNHTGALLTFSTDTDASQAYLGNYPYFIIMSSAYGSFRVFSYFGGVENTRIPWSINKKSTYSLNYLSNRKWILDGDASGSISTMSNLPNDSIIIFGERYQGSAYNPTHGKIYSLIFSENNTIVRNFVPCYRKSDSKPGLFDLVNGVFYTNAGTGEFLVGPLVDVPSEYQKVEYIESTGTQYIDTGIETVKTLGFEVKFLARNLDTDFYSLLGCQNSSSRYFINNAHGGWPLYIWVGSSNYYVNIGDASETDFNIISTDLANSTIANYNETTGLTNTVSLSQTDINSIASGGNFYLFTRNAINTSSNPLPMAMKLFSCQFFDNDATVRRFVPCYRKSDNEIGLFDLIKGVFYTNQGTGTFLKGPDVN